MDTEFAMKSDSEPQDRRDVVSPPRRKFRPLYWVTLTLMLLVGLVAAHYFLIIDWDGRPFCHKNITLSLRFWMQEKGGGAHAFPNVGGVGKTSIQVIAEEVGTMDWATNYHYVPGLQDDDPPRLVVMYMTKPTRWTWHGSPPTIFEKKKWIVVPVDFESTPGHPGECSERLSEAEFKTRLRETIDFVRTNARPNWQVIVAEQTAFLDSLERTAR